MKSYEYTDFNHNAISIDDIVKSSRGDVEYVVAALHTDNSGQQRVVGLHPEHGVQTFSPGALVVISTLKTRVIELTQSISEKRADVLTDCAGMLQYQENESQWSFEIAVDLTDDLRGLDALHRQLEAIDPNNPYLYQ